jgi:hypothetical protein
MLKLPTSVKNGRGESLRCIDWLLVLAVCALTPSKRGFTGRTPLEGLVHPLVIVGAAWSHDIRPYTSLKLSPWTCRGRLGHAHTAAWRPGRSPKATASRSHSEGLPAAVGKQDGCCRPSSAWKWDLRPWERGRGLGLAAPSSVPRHSPASLSADGVGVMRGPRDRPFGRRLWGARRRDHCLAG